MWIKVKGWQGHIYPDPAGKPVLVRDGEVRDVPDELGAVLLEKGIAKKATPPAADMSAEPKPARKTRRRAAPDVTPDAADTEGAPAEPPTE